MAEIRYMDTSVLLVRCWRRLSIKNRPHPNHLVLRFFTHRPRPAKSAPSDGWIFAPRSFLTLPSLSLFLGSARGAVHLVFRPSWLPPWPPPCCKYLDGQSRVCPSIVGLTLFRAETRPFRVSTPQTHTTRFSKKSQSTMFNSTGSSASGRYAHSHNDPRDPEIGDSDSRDRLGTSGCRTTSWRRAF